MLALLSASKSFILFLSRIYWAGNITALSHEHDDDDERIWSLRRCVHTCSGAHHNDFHQMTTNTLNILLIVIYWHTSLTWKNPRISHRNCHIPDLNCMGVTMQQWKWADLQISQTLSPKFLILQCFCMFTYSRYISVVAKLTSYR
jgi:hypothetical protein